MLTLTLPVAVYRFFDADDGLLYVGISDSLGTRFGAHRNTAWWPKAVRNTVQWYDTRAQALAAEYKAITTESPQYNIAEVPFVAPTEEEAAALPRFVPGPPKKRRPRGSGGIIYRSDRNLWVAQINFGWTPDGKLDRRQKASRDKATVEQWLAEAIAEKEKAA